MSSLSSALPVYYAGFDPGSGRAGLVVLSADQVRREPWSLTMDSAIATGTPELLLKRGGTNATLADVLGPDECVIEWNQAAYYLLELVQEGRNTTAALNNPHRYWDVHACTLLLALASKLIPEHAFELRLVTALPVTLYEQANRQRMKDALSNAYVYCYNGRQRQALVQVGYVAMEGQGILIHEGLSHGAQAVLDIGERTVDAVAANGQRLLTSLCQGNGQLGIGQIAEALRHQVRHHGRVLPSSQIRQWLWAWAHHQPLPIIHTSQGIIAEGELVASIEQARQALAKDVYSFASSLWNVEGEAVGERFEQIVLAGGGAYYIGDLLRTLLPRMIIPPAPEEANMRGYAELALTLEAKVPNVWERD